MVIMEIQYLETLGQVIEAATAIESSQLIVLQEDQQWISEKPILIMDYL